MDRVNDHVEFCSYIIFGNTWVPLLARESEEEFVFKLSEKTVRERKAIKQAGKQ